MKDTVVTCAHLFTAGQRRLVDATWGKAARGVGGTRHEARAEARGRKAWTARSVRHGRGAWHEARGARRDAGPVRGGSGTRHEA